MTTALRAAEIPTAEVRAARPGDAAAMQAFVDGLGGASRRWRFHGGVARCSERLAETLVGSRGTPAQVWVACEAGSIVGEARLVLDAGDPAQAELALSVADAWQGRGLAGALLGTLIGAARRAGVCRLVAESWTTTRASSVSCCATASASRCAGATKTASCSNASCSRRRAAR